jgi:hypothetical protein
MENIMRSLVALGAVLLAGCGALHRSAAAAPTAPVPCAVFVPSADSLDWKLVQAQGFTFCVPPGWRRSGARGWQSEGTGIEWRVGSPPESPVLGPRLFSPGIRGAVDPPRHFVEIIGGEGGELWDVRAQDANYTFAYWSAKRVYFQGKANGPHSADVELMIYRTVRFDDDDLGR